MTGRYFDGLKPTRSSLDSHDSANANDLWQTSQHLTGPLAT
jgi:hypothetical protein